jgi:transcriptional regulator with XRE-family HTH domain
LGVTSNLDSEIGRRLRQARLAENLTQDGLAQRLGISFQQVQKYENGSNRVSSSRLWAIGNALGVPVTYFFEGLDQTEVGPSSDFDDENTLPDRTIRVARMLNEMPDGEVKDKVFNLIKAFSKAS